MNKILSKIGIDQAIKYVLMGRGITVLSGVFILYLVSTQLTPEQQGIYYTFSSLVSLQVIFELGLTTVIIQFVSHEMDGLHFNITQQDFTGDIKNINRINSLIRLSVKWYAFIGLMILIVIGPIGYFFFNGDNLTNSWFYAWVVLVVFTAINITFISVTSIYEGCGFVAKINRLRFHQSLLAGLISIIVLLAGYGLFAVSSMAISGTIIFGLFSNKYALRLVRTAFLEKARAHIVSWRQEIMPMQWRIALSWISGYFIFFIINPIAFKAFGANFAGQLGITMSVCNMVMNIGLAWVTTKCPYWGGVIVRQDRFELDRSFKIAFKQSLIFTAFALICGCVLLNILSYFHLSTAQRFLPTHLFIAIAIAVIGNHIIACLATYIRVHKKEKMTVPSILMAILTVTVFAIFSYFKEDELFVVSYTLLVWGYFVPVTFMIYKKFKSSYEKK
ncbi:hypothetical protein [Enterobacter chuandaensis]|uniref:Polysaccharide biosynthesis protein n=1 Tax=Enterobacter chuandaensis TaxID=2497875 RepID=A0AA96RQ04_9ENTR|nr:hypothetical protein [Enterobacter chuandaensis]MCW4782452.1 hypothetical protein [Enterobacter chuandaensis]MDA4761806.1 hypothetical protein [Enterobacter chuandaensis]WNS36500.1 hypothetical protein RQP59_15590 [Enterobacter chuandaensis]